MYIFKEEKNTLHCMNYFSHFSTCGGHTYQMHLSNHSLFFFSLPITKQRCTTDRKEQVGEAEGQHSVLSEGKQNKSAWALHRFACNTQISSSTVNLAAIL